LYKKAWIGFNKLFDAVEMLAVPIFVLFDKIHLGHAIFDVTDVTIEFG
jgi:hypothetical protein